MNNPMVAKFLEVGAMELVGGKLSLAFWLDDLISKELAASKMKTVFSFNSDDGKLVFEKVLGRDVNNDFYNEANGNLESREEELKAVIVGVLFSEYKKL